MPTPSRRPAGRNAARGTVLATLLAVFLLTAPSQAATYQTTVEPNPFSYSAAQQLVYRLHVTTGAASEQLTVSAGPGPQFPGGGYFMDLQEMTLEGAGTVLDRSRMIAIADRFCAPVFADTHGNHSFSTPSIKVELPANTTSTIALPARPYGNAPWRGMDLSVEFRIGTASPQLVRSPNPVNVGRHGLPISFRTDPPGAFGACLSFITPPSVPLGRDVLLSGRTDPAVAGQLMTIRATRRGETGPEDLASVRIGADGAFGHRWRPPAPGDYAVGALYRSQSPALTDDFSEARALRVLPPRPRLRLAAVTAARRVRCRGRRCVIVAHGSVRRPRAAVAATCAGALRVRVASGKRRLLSTRTRVRRTCRYRVRRRFSLRSARQRYVTVRVSYLGDAAFQPMHGRAVRVKIRR